MELVEKIFKSDEMNDKINNEIANLKSKILSYYYNNNEYDFDKLITDEDNETIYELARYYYHNSQFIKDFNSTFNKSVLDSVFLISTNKDTDCLLDIRKNEVKMLFLFFDINTIDDICEAIVNKLIKKYGITTIFKKYFEYNLYRTFSNYIIKKPFITLSTSVNRDKKESITIELSLYIHDESEEQTDDLIYYLSKSFACEQEIISKKELLKLFNKYIDCINKYCKKVNSKFSSEIKYKEPIEQLDIIKKFYNVYNLREVAYYLPYIRKTLLYIENYIKKTDCSSILNIRNNLRDMIDFYILINLESDSNDIILVIKNNIGFISNDQFTEVFCICNGINYIINNESMKYTINEIIYYNKGKLIIDHNINKLFDSYINKNDDDTNKDIIAIK